MKKWSTKDIIIIALIGFLFGGIFLATSLVYVPLKAALGAVGYTHHLLTQYYLDYG